MTSFESASPRILRNVQVLRAVAAILVVFVHIDKLLSSLDLPPFGGGGVDIFFVISGFIMTYTTIDRDSTPWSFMADRIARIVPPYWAITVAVFAVACIAPTLLQATRPDWTELFKSLLFVPFMKSNGLVQPTLFVGWTLNYEMFFYLLFAAGLAFPNKKLGAGSIIVWLAFLVAMGLLEQPESVIGQFYTSITMLDFALGMLIALSFRQIPIVSGVLVRPALALLVSLGLAAAVVLPLFLPNVSSFFVSGLPAALVVAGAVTLERSGWSLRHRWLLVLGNASYSIYLTHPFVTQLARKSAAFVPPDPVAALLLIAATLVSVCLVGLTVHYFLEQPLSSLFRRLLKVRRLNARMDKPEPIGSL